MDSQNSTIGSGFIDPLFRIQAMAERALRSLPSPAINSLNADELLSNASKALNETVQQATHILQVIDHLRSMGHAPKTGIRTDSTAPVQACVAGVLQAMHAEYPLENIVVLKILPNDLFPAPLSHSYLETVLFQLIYNARERILQTEKSGMISIEAAEKVCLTPENSSQRWFILRISDNGPEISRDDLTHVFDPLLRFTPNCFGLYIAKKIVDHHYGTMRVETSSRNTVFHIELPA